MHIVNGFLFFKNYKGFIKSNICKETILTVKLFIMKNIKLYQVNCNLLFEKDEEIVGFSPKNKNLHQFIPSLEKAIEIYEGINPSQFDKKEVLRAEYRGLGNTYTKYILMVEMPLKLYNFCSFEDNGEKCTEEKRLEYINEMVWDMSVNWQFSNIKDVDFDIDWKTMTFSEFRDYKLQTA